MLLRGNSGKSTCSGKIPGEMRLSEGEMFGGCAPVRGKDPEKAPVRKKTLGTGKIPEGALVRGKFGECAPVREKSGKTLVREKARFLTAFLLPLRHNGADPKMIPLANPLAP